MTVTIYGLGCRSTKKARQWMIKYKIPFVERNLKEAPLTVIELQDLLRKTIDGTDDIIAKRSASYKALNLNIEELPLLELLEMIHDEPRLLRSPIIVDERKIQVGYHEEEIRQFIPRKTREFLWLQWRMQQPIES
ncbi:regulatory protein spx [Mesobacillus persicus]|uniref:Regulatory protein spx n=1 Tax=Mesobacillus persicus TaxID=930146 RepID=A0A1H8CYP2_9BACI|nr:Spx/MgsR family RNA polymerase-binding regulatory protein [Mesobacillus persicus]SEN00090.1 regulatory protein spx [Mesobacillus persicus]